MADLTLKEKLQPSLLDRLTDRDPGNNRESRERRVISETNLRECVIRDLGWLLNTTHLAATEDLDDFEYAGGSVLNFGIPDLAGLVASSLDARKLEQGLREAIIRYEPRIIPSSLKVSVLKASSAHHGAVAFAIEADIWAQPMPLSLYLQTQVDLETGNFSVVESSR